MIYVIYVYHQEVFLCITFFNVFSYLCCKVGGDEDLYLYRLDEDLIPNWYVLSLPLPCLLC